MINAMTGANKAIRTPGAFPYYRYALKPAFRTLRGLLNYTETVVTVLA